MSHKLDMSWLCMQVTIKKIIIVILEWLDRSDKIRSSRETYIAHVFQQTIGDMYFGCKHTANA